MIYSTGKFTNGLSGAVYQLGAIGSPTVGTLELWVKVVSSSGIYVAIGDSSTNYPWIGINGGKAAFLSPGSSAAYTTTTVIIGDGVWHHLALTTDGTNTRFWVDGSLASTIANTSGFITAHMSVAGFDTTSTYDWPGSVDEIRFSNAIRYTSGFTAPTTAFSDDSSTIALYHLESDCSDSHVIATSHAGVLTRGTASYTAGKFGNALSGAVYTVGSVGTSASGTIEAWVKTTSTSGVYVAVGSSSYGATWIGISSGKAAAQTPNQGGSQSLSNIAINDGLWHHIALTVDGTNGRLWVDGTLAVTTAATGTLGGDGNTAIGGFNSPGTYDWPGQIDEVRYSNTVRYSSAFSVPAAAFSDDLYTLALYHLESDVTDSHAVSSVLIAPNDSNIVYSPYTWDVTSARAKTINSGAYFSVELTGSVASIIANFDMTNASSPLSQVSYRVDSGAWTSVAIASSITLTIPSVNVWSKHYVEVRVKSTSETVNRWNSPQNTAVLFTGFTVTPSAVTTAIFRKKRFNLLCYGDSITEGVRTLGSTQTNDTDRNDSALAWAYPLGALLGAEVGVVGFGATGLNTAGSGGVPALTTSYNLLWAGTLRVFTPVPDLILLNEGTNDGGDITTNATTVLNGLIAAASTSKIVIVQQWNGTTHKTQWQAAIAACSNPGQVTYIDTTGWWSSNDASDSLHPYGYSNITDLAPRLAAAVGPLLVGTVNPKRYVNISGVAKAIQ